VLVGPNNSGKSTIIEAFGAFSRHDPRDAQYGTSFPKGMRNMRAGGRVHLRAFRAKGETSELKTIEAGGAMTETLWGGVGAFVLPSRRLFHPFFERFLEYMARSTYANDGEHPSLRSSRSTALTNASSAHMEVASTSTLCSPKWSTQYPNGILSRRTTADITFSFNSETSPIVVMGSAMAC
jgi:hypothetical protein